MTQTKAVRSEKDVVPYERGTNPRLDLLVDWDKETILCVNWEKGRYPVAVPLAVEDKRAYAGREYLRITDGVRTSASIPSW